MNIRVVIAEDEALVRSGIIAVLARAPDIDIVGEAPDGCAAGELVAALHPDVLVTDLRMPGRDGVELTRLVSAEPSGPRVLVLTGFGSDPDVHAALRAGASGYLLKHEAPRALAPAVRAVAAGGGWLDPTVVPTLLAAVRRAPEATAVMPTRLTRLTTREREVLVLLGQGLDNGEIAQALWLGPGTVKTHISRILHKTGCRDRAQAIVLAYATGLVATTA